MSTHTTRFLINDFYYDAHDPESMLILHLAVPKGKIVAPDGVACNMMTLDVQRDRHLENFLEYIDVFDLYVTVRYKVSYYFESTVHAEGVVLHYEAHPGD